MCKLFFIQTIYNKCFICIYRNIFWKPLHKLAGVFISTTGSKTANVMHSIWFKLIHSLFFIGFDGTCTAKTIGSGTFGRDIDTVETEKTHKFKCEMQV